MKTKTSSAPDLYGPETPGYAHLNELARRKAIAIKAPKTRKGKQPSSPADEAKPKPS